MTAARTGAVDAVRALLDRGADVRRKHPAKGQTALMWAAAENNAGVVKLLVERGADVKERSNGSFSAVPVRRSRRSRERGHGAARRRRQRRTRRCPTARAPSCSRSSTRTTSWRRFFSIAAPIRTPTGRDGRRCTRSPGRGGTTPGSTCPGRWRPAVSTASTLVRRLVAKGADVNARQKKEPRDGNRNMLNRLGSTPFLLAAKSADVPLMRVLLECGADARLTTNNGTTPLMAAAGVGIWAPGENPGHTRGSARRGQADRSTRAAAT